MCIFYCLRDKDKEDRQTQTGTVWLQSQNANKRATRSVASRLHDYVSPLSSSQSLNPVVCSSDLRVTQSGDHNGFG